MNAEFGKTNMINLTAGQKNGLGVVAAEAYRGGFHLQRPVSDPFSGDRHVSSPSPCSNLPEVCEGLSLDTTPRTVAPKCDATIVPCTATWTSVARQGSSDSTLLVDCRLPAPAWAALVLNHALCG